jgi:ubiquinone/menaquinone biosynthesis C-methylase UbiE
MLTKMTVGVYRAMAGKIIPNVRPSQRAYHDRLQETLTPGCEWLDLGCGHQIMPPWVGADEQKLVRQCRSVTGIDLDFPSLVKNRIFAGRVAMADLEHIPFAAESFDVVTTNMVVEHLKKPLDVLTEVRRVLRPGGRFLYHTPNRNAPALRIAAHTPDALKKSIVWMLEGRAEEDVFPTHYRMNTVEDVTSLAEKAGLKIERLEQITSSAMTYVLGPLALPEILFIRLIEADRFKNLRPNLLVTLEK